jgi:hypothetical protein
MEIFELIDEAPVKNGYGGRSTGTSPLPQIADDVVHRAKSAEVGQSGPTLLA